MEIKKINNGFRVGCWFAITLAAVMMTVLVIKTPATHPAWLPEFDKMVIPLMLLRWGLYLLIFIKWKSLMEKIAVRYHWDDDDLADAILQRSRCVCWIIIIELIVGQNIFGRLIHFIFSIFL
jgi:hypothetical protein